MSVRSGLGGVQTFMLLLKPTAHRRKPVFLTVQPDCMTCLLDLEAFSPEVNALFVLKHSQLYDCGYAKGIGRHKEKVHYSNRDLESQDSSPDPCDHSSGLSTLHSAHLFPGSSEDPRAEPEQGGYVSERLAPRASSCAPQEQAPMPTCSSSSLGRTGTAGPWP